jgi:hypothetical protein
LAGAQDESEKLTERFFGQLDTTPLAVPQPRVGLAVTSAHQLIRENSEKFGYHRVRWQYVTRSTS